METKIPPPLVTLAFGLSIYFSRWLFPAVEIAYSLYLGMACVLGSMAMFFNVIGGIVLIALFCAYITKFQIIPEERAMRDLFLDDFDKYTKVTRRWL